MNTASSTEPKSGGARRNPWIISIIAVGGLAIGLVAAFIQAPRYRSEALVSVQNPVGTVAQEALIMTSPIVLAPAAATLGFEPEVSVEANEAAKLLTITAEAGDAEEAAGSATAVAESYLQVQTGAAAIIAQPGEVPDGPFSPNRLIYALVGSAAGALLGLALFWMLPLLRRTSSLDSAEVPPAPVLVDSPPASPPYARSPQPAQTNWPQRPSSPPASSAAPIWRDDIHATTPANPTPQSGFPADEPLVPLGISERVAPAARSARETQPAYSTFGSHLQEESEAPDHPIATPAVDTSHQPPDAGDSGTGTGDPQDGSLVTASPDTAPPDTAPPDTAPPDTAPPDTAPPGASHSESDHTTEIALTGAERRAHHEKEVRHRRLARDANRLGDAAREARHTTQIETVTLVHQQELARVAVQHERAIAELTEQLSASRSEVRTLTASLRRVSGSVEDRAGDLSAQIETLELEISTLRGHLASAQIEHARVLTERSALADRSLDNARREYRQELEKHVHTHRAALAEHREELDGTLDVFRRKQAAALEEQHREYEDALEQERGRRDGALRSAAERHERELNKLRTDNQQALERQVAQTKDTISSLRRSGHAADEKNAELTEALQRTQNELRSIRQQAHTADVDQSQTQQQLRDDLTLVRRELVAEKERNAALRADVVRRTTEANQKVDQVLEDRSNQLAELEAALTRQRDYADERVREVSAEAEERARAAARREADLTAKISQLERVIIEANVKPG